MNNSRITIIKKEDSFLFKNNKIKDFNGNKNNKNNIKIFTINNIFIYSIILLLIIIIKYFLLCSQPRIFISGKIIFIINTIYCYI